MAKAKPTDKPQNGNAVKFPDTKMIKLSNLIAAPYNPRTMTQEAMDGLKASIQKFGLVQYIVMNKRTGHVVGGHQRIAAMMALGIKEAPCHEVDVSEAEERALNVVLNNPEIQGEFNNDLLVSLLDQIKNDGAVDFEALNMDALLDGLVTPPETFPSYDEDLATTHKCPKCGYEWNGGK